MPHVYHTNPARSKPRVEFSDIVVAMNSLASLLQDRPVAWVKASDEARKRSQDTAPTEEALGRAELLWGATDLSNRFRELLDKRGVSIYDRTIEHHFTGSAIVLDPKTRGILMTFHPLYQGWQQLGGHDEGEHDPMVISAREAWEESGIDDLWICDWPILVYPHPAHKCRSVTDGQHNWHYDICYMSVALDANFKASEESADMRWVSLDELKQFVAEGEASQMVLDMTQNALQLYDALASLKNLPAS